MSGHIEIDGNKIPVIPAPDFFMVDSTVSKELAEALAKWRESDEGKAWIKNPPYPVIYDDPESVAALKARILELENQASLVGRQNPAWEAGYQRALYIMPDEIVRAYASVSHDNPTYEELKLVFDTVEAVMRGVVDGETK